MRLQDDRTWELQKLAKDAKVVSIGIIILLYFFHMREITMLRCLFPFSLQYSLFCIPDSVSLPLRRFAYPSSGCRATRQSINLTLHECAIEP
jgi:hypothetical protein